MKIINLEAFRELPEGVVYSKYEPCIFSEMNVKGETLQVDFYEMELVGNLDAHDSGDYIDKCTLAENGVSIALDFDTVGRDGMFKKDQLFAVYERADLLGLAGVLTKALSSTPDTI